MGFDVMIAQYHAWASLSSIFADLNAQNLGLHRLRFDGPRLAFLVQMMIECEPLTFIHSLPSDLRLLQLLQGKLSLLLLVFSQPRPPSLVFTVIHPKA